MEGNSGGFPCGGYQGLCIPLDESRVDPRATAWLGEDMSAAGGDTQLHQAAAGPVFLAVDSIT